MTLDDRMRNARADLDRDVAAAAIPANDIARRSRRRAAGRAGSIATALVIAAIAVAVVVPRDNNNQVHVDSPLPGNVGPFIPDINDPTNPHNIDSHWHAALGVFDCGHWMGDASGSGIWNWPTATPTGAPGRAQTPRVYAGLHSHDDGIIHMEPATPDDAGVNATLGQYFDEGGWQLSAAGFDFLGTTVRNGDLCHTAPGVLRWWVNGQAQQGDPAAYKLVNNDIVVLSFDAVATYPGEPPSTGNLPDSEGVTPTLPVAGPVIGTLHILVAPNGELRYEPRELTAQTGVWRITLSTGGAPHAFSFDDPATLGGELVLPTGGAEVSQRVFFSHAGDYTFSCKIPGHAEAGMRGVVHVTGQPIKTVEQAEKAAQGG